MAEPVVGRPSGIMTGREGGSGFELTICDLEEAICRATAEALERACVGLILTDRSAKVRFVNRVAEPEISGLFHVEGGYLKVAEISETARLHRAIREVAEGGAYDGREVDIKFANGHDRRAVLAPLELAFDGKRKRLAMVMIPPAPAAPIVRHQDQIGDLTPAEARLLAALAGGQRLRQYADASGIALSTAKTHLRSLFDKTGERRQADLIRRALSDSQFRERLRGADCRSGAR